MAEELSVLVTNISKTTLRVLSVEEGDLAPGESVEILLPPKSHGPLTYILIRQARASGG